MDPQLPIALTGGYVAFSFSVTPMAAFLQRMPMHHNLWISVDDIHGRCNKNLSYNQSCKIK